ALITERQLPEAINGALLDGSGPYAPYLALAADSDGLGNAPAVPRPAIAPAAVLRAQLHALASTDALQGVV
ncbi:MAG: EAL domain-containing protein, partial [Betaproteobacteria bacterium]